MLERCGEKGNFLHCWWKCKLMQPLWRTVWRLLIKLKIELIWPCSPTSGHLSGDNHNLRRYMHPNIHCSTVYNTQGMGTIYTSTNKGKNEDMAQTHNEILLSHKKEWNNFICLNMDRPRECQTEWSKSEKDKYHMILLKCETKKKKKKVQMSLFTK